MNCRLKPFLDAPELGHQSEVGIVTTFTLDLPLQHGLFLEGRPTCLIRDMYATEGHGIVISQVPVGPWVRSFLPADKLSHTHPYPWHFPQMFDLLKL